MPIAPDRPNPLERIFGAPRPLIGTIHCLPLPGTPRYDGATMTAIVDRAVRDAAAYAEGGMHGLIVENHGDVPFLPPHEIGPETPAALAVIAAEIARAVELPFGINVLANAPIPALAVAKATGARFVRVNQWANAYVANEGLMSGEAGAVLRYRKEIDATRVAIFADVHVKHGAHAIVGDRPVEEQARDVEFFDADVAIVTGNRTGDAVPVEEIEAVRAGTRLPLIAGSGMTAQNVAELLPRLDGAIVASSLKRDGVWWNEVDVDRVRAFVEAAANID